MFFAELLRADLPARNIVDSDFTFLNERLATHYGIPGVRGRRRCVASTLPRGSERGGLMTQASVLKVTANGTTTSPVLRGHWITERILGIETRPPPPSVKAVEPDIRGAVTIRQQLAKHRDNPSCASCHTKMDPPGFALESFDVMGAHRERYRAVAENVKPEPGFGMNGQAFAFHYGLPVDSAGELPDGRTFRDVREFKRLLSRRRSARRPQPRQAAGGLRHGCAGALLRPRRTRADLAARERAPVRRAHAGRGNCPKRVVPNQMNNETSRSLHRHPSGHLAPALSPGRGRRDVAAVARCDAAAVRAGRVRLACAQCQAAPDVRHLQQPGLRPDLFFPTGAGRDYAASPYLKLLEEHRNDFTVFSGVSHPNVDGGHPSDISFLTAAPHPASSSFRNTISLDQYIAERIGTLTRFPSLTLAVNGAARSLSWTGTGVAIPPEERASDVFNQLFLQGTPEQVEAQIRRLDTGRSILDAVADQAKDLERNVGARDRSRLEQYFTSVRDLEHRLQESRGWERKPKPVVNVAAPAELGKSGAIHGQGESHVRPRAARVRNRLHPRDHAHAEQRRHAGRHHSRRDHHRQLPQPLAPRKVGGETRAAQGARRMAHEAAARIFSAISKAVSEGGETLLDRTMILYGSNLGDANAHSTTNLPTLFAGGGFRHGQHLAFDRAQNYPLPNLFVSMLQRMGLDEDKFASSTGTMRGLEMT